MLWWKIRRILTVLAACVLAVGLITHGVGGPDIVVKSTMAVMSDMSSSGDMPMSGKCNGCAGDEQGIASTACFAFCSAVIPAPAIAFVRYAVLVETLSPGAEQNRTGQADPPDPYPPRPTVLS